MWLWIWCIVIGIINESMFIYHFVMSSFFACMQWYLSPIYNPSTEHLHRLPCLAGNVLNVSFVIDMFMTNTSLVNMIVFYIQITHWRPFVVFNCDWELYPLENNNLVIFHFWVRGENSHVMKNSRHTIWNSK